MDKGRSTIEYGLRMEGCSSWSCIQTGQADSSFAWSSQWRGSVSLSCLPKEGDFPVAGLS